MPDPPPRAERPGERKNVSGEGREPSPGRKLPPRATIKKRSAPPTPCSDQTRGPEPSPGDQGRGDPKNPMGKSAESPDHRENPEEKPLEPPTVAPLTRASVDPLAPPSGWAERVGQSGRGEKDPCGTSGEGLAVRQDRSARASARSARAGEACDMVGRELEHDLESSSSLGFQEKILCNPCDMVAESSAQQIAVAVEIQNVVRAMSGHDMVTEKNCDLANEENRSNEKDPAQQIAGASAEKKS